jgi:drug/metabolite transporter (DMT)-like permease
MLRARILGSRPLLSTTHLEMTVEKFTSSPILMIAVNLLLCSFGQILLKLGMNAQKHEKAVSGAAAAVMGAFKSMLCPQVMFGLMLYGCSLVLWLMILKKVNLSLAFPMMSFTYVLVVILSSVILKERIISTTIAGLLFICIGVALIGVGMSHSGGK